MRLSSQKYESWKMLNVITERTLQIESDHRLTTRRVTWNILENWILIIKKKNVQNDSIYTKIQRKSLIQNRRLFFPDNLIWFLKCFELFVCVWVFVSWTSNPVHSYNKNKREHNKNDKNRKRRAQFQLLFQLIVEYFFHH